MVSYSFINLGGGFGISTYYHAHKLACLAGMIYCGYGIITDFNALSAAMWWWSLSKITWFCIGYALFLVARAYYGFSYMLCDRRLFVKID
ncbi:putative membrane protein [Helicobacter pylori Hp P-25]|nr:putative membrane protein [Helicobacter pylori Hp P-25]EJC33305.1 putative membrane protein [Helicobacter pylori Hp P-25c]EJC38927.1 putative membrane protein [Helicobacter pylori Hp P-25d]